MKKTFKGSSLKIYGESPHVDGSFCRRTQQPYSFQLFPALNSFQLIEEPSVLCAAIEQLFKLNR